MKRAVLLPVALLALTASADDKHVDRYGDPIPAGATQRLGTLRLRHAAGTTAVAFSHDGTKAASSGEDKAIRVWELSSGKELAKLDVPAGATTLVFTKDDNQIISHAQGGIRIHDIATKKVVKQFGVLAEHAAIAPTGDRVVSTDQNGTVRLNEIPSGKEVLELPGEAAVDALAFSPDGTTFAYGSRDNAIRVWDALVRKELGRLYGHDGWVSGLAFAPDGKTIWSASADKTVRSWQGGKPLKKLEGHKDFVDLVAVSPDGRLVASWSHEGTLKVWDSATGKERASRHLKATSLAFSPDSKILGVASSNALGLWTAESLKEHPVAAGHEALVSCVAFTSDSRTVASGSNDETIRTWDVSGARELKRIDAHAGGVSALAYGAGSRLLASGGKEPIVRVWDPTTGTQSNAFEGHRDTVVSVAFSPDAKFLASCGDNTIRIWDLAQGKMARQIDAGGDPGPLVWSGDHIACGSGDHVIRTWDVTTFKEGPKLDGQKELHGLAFSPDGKVLAAVGEEPALKLWDPVSGKEIKTITVPDTYLACVAFSSDGKRLAVGRVDGPVRIIEVSSGKELKTLETSGQGAYSIAFASDGKLVAWACIDGTVLVGDAH
jgi:WD40 repeat protein